MVPSQRFEMDTDADPIDVYRMLRVSNPSPYMYLLNVPDEDGGLDFSIVGSSPEALVTVQDGWATTHPIAGTRWRGATEEEDVLLEKELLADEKERAEHLMLVDLGRNDLGRVCVPGTVRVEDYSHIERYSHVMHLVSTVTGLLAEGKTALDAVTACFPAGTLSGAPKVRAMELIEEVEKTRRGLYGGVVGYLDFAGNADFAIAIRTALMRDGTAYVQAGGGVVADSNGPYEYNEAANKAKAVLNAIAAAETLAVEPMMRDRRQLGRCSAARAALRCGSRPGCRGSWSAPSTGWASRRRDADGRSLVDGAAAAGPDAARGGDRSRRWGRGWPLRLLALLVAAASAAVGYLAISLWVVPDVAVRAADLAGVPVAFLVGTERQYAGAVVDPGGGRAAHCRRGAARCAATAATGRRPTKYVAPAARRRDAAPATAPRQAPTTSEADDVGRPRRGPRPDRDTPDTEGR